MESYQLFNKIYNKINKTILTNILSQKLQNKKYYGQLNLKKINQLSLPNIYLFN